MRLLALFYTLSPMSPNIFTCCIRNCCKRCCKYIGHSVSINHKMSNFNLQHMFFKNWVTSFFLKQMLILLGLRTRFCHPTHLGDKLFGGEMSINLLIERRKKYFLLDYNKRILWIDEFLTLNNEIAKLKGQNCQFDFTSDELDALIHCPWPVDITNWEVSLDERGYYCSTNTGKFKKTRSNF